MSCSDQRRVVFICTICDLCRRTGDPILPAQRQTPQRTSRICPAREALPSRSRISTRLCTASTGTTRQSAPTSGGRVASAGRDRQPSDTVSIDRRLTSAAAVQDLLSMTIRGSNAVENSPVIFVPVLTSRRSVETPPDTVILARGATCVSAVRSIGQYVQP